MMDSVEDFISKVEGFDNLSSADRCDYFLYYLTEIKQVSSVRPIDIESCFRDLKITAYSNIPQYLAVHTKKGRGRKAKFMKTKSGYHLERERKESIKKTVLINKHFAEANKTLRSLLTQVKNTSEQSYLAEAIKAFEVEAFRAAILMVWILTIDHFFQYILDNKLTEFNTVLAAVTDRRVKVSVIKTKDDFSDIPEGKFIEICRSAGIISNDVRKILDTKLGIRNTAGHPSNVKVVSGTAFEFIEDIVTNVFLKY